MDLSTCEENDNDPTVHLNIDASQPLFSQDMDMDMDNQQVVGM